MNAETRDCPGFVPRNQGLSQGFQSTVSPGIGALFGFWISCLFRISSLGFRYFLMGCPKSFHRCPEDFAPWGVPRDFAKYSPSGFRLARPDQSQGCIWISDFALVSGLELWIWVLLTLLSPSPVHPPVLSSVRQSDFPTEISRVVVPASAKFSTTHHLHKSSATVAVTCCN